MNVKNAIGIMSGTSLDGIDIAFLKTDGLEYISTLFAKSYPYTSSQRILLRKATKVALNWKFKKDCWPAFILEAEKIITDITLQHLKNFFRTYSIKKKMVDIIGFHGQTLLHSPPEKKGKTGRTLQIGDGASLAKAILIPVISNFRANDMKYGGQGAPLVPIYHKALLEKTNFRNSGLVLNLGGVANLTFIQKNNENRMSAGDVGPGNGPIDAWVESHGLGVMDKNGKYAEKGSVHQGLLNEFKKKVFFQKPFPKSADRWDFSFSDKLKTDKVGFEDGCATLTAFIVDIICDFIQRYFSEAQYLIVTGGGRYNQTIIQGLKQGLEQQVLITEDVGWKGDFLEAEAFAYLAVRSCKGLPFTFPLTTGVRSPVSGGEYHDINN